MNDSELLARYVENGSTEAFRELMLRHVDLVYGAACRQVRDLHLAEDITQAVFILLAQKAKSVRSGGTLTGWLVLTAHYAAKDARKIAFRRRFHEYKAAQMRTARDKEQEEVWREVRPGLDAALARLPVKQRSIVALHYLEGRSFREVGETLGMSEDAARMTCNRAIQRLRDSLNEPAVGTATALGALLASREMVAAPVRLRAAIVANGVTGHQASSTAVAIARSVASGMSTKAGMISIPLAAVVVAALMTGAVALSRGGAAQRAETTSGMHMPLNGVEFANGVGVELLGVGRYPGGGVWWQANGGALSASPGGMSAAAGAGRAEGDRRLYQFAIRVSKLPAGRGDLWLYAAGDSAAFWGTPMQRSQEGDGSVYYGVAALSSEQTRTNVALALSTEGTETLRLDAQGHELGPAPETMDGFIPVSVEREGQGTAFRLPLTTDPYLRFGFWATAIGVDGREHPRVVGGAPYTGEIGDGSQQSVFTFDIEKERIREFRIERAKTREWVIFRHVSLAAGSATDAFAERGRNPGVDHSMRDEDDHDYLALVGNLVRALKSQDLSTAARVCNQLRVGTHKRAGTVEGTPYSYVVADGSPVLEKVQAAIKAGDLAGALSLLEAGGSSGERVWEMAQQISVTNHAESLQYP